MSTYNSFAELAEDQGLTEEQQRHELVECYHNTYKSVVGCRPRHLDLDAFTIEGLVRLIEDISQEGKEMRDGYSDECIKAMMKAGAPDRETAIRWAKQS